LGLQKVVIGGSAAPRAMIQRFWEQFGAFVIHGWGMTETSPSGTVSNLLKKHENLSREQIYDLQMKQGRPNFGVKLRIEQDGKVQPHDGKAVGNLKIKGYWITKGYFKGAGGHVLDKDGYFDTGDVATIDPQGYMTITDRSKDVIKTGGEWISSIDLENAVMSHPGVQQSAVIGVFHPKWQERPLMLIIPKPTHKNLTKEDILKYLEPRIARWWLPDDVVFVKELPIGPTGKVLKKDLRDKFKDHKLPTIETDAHSNSFSNASIKSRI
jgi:acyl-CoA synthetase (AMP-forming)/AMP-acid ligase II